MRTKILSSEQLKEAQRYRDKGMSLKEIGKIYGVTSMCICKNTVNKQIVRPKKPKVKKSSTEKKNKGHMLELQDFKRTVRVLTNIPDGFKAPTRGMGW